MSDTPQENSEATPTEETPGAEAEVTNDAPPVAQSVAQADTPIETPAGSSFQDSEIKDEKADNTSLDLDFILDIPLTVTVEVGRTKLLIQELLQLGQGSVIELNKLMGEPFEVMVNEKLVARGEIVVVNDRFGVRLTDIISPSERVQTLA